MTRRWILLGLPMVAVAVVLVLQGLRSGPVEAERPPRARAGSPGAAPRVDAPRVAVRPAPTLPPGSPVKVTSTAVEVLNSPVPYATSRPVNSWFDFDSAISELSGAREVLGDQTYREEVIRMTVEFLELAPERVPAFVSTLRGVQADLRRIQQEMGQVLGSYPVDLSDAQLRRLQSEAEDRFQPDRDSALARFDSFLDGRDRHREFRGVLDRWVTRCCGLDP